MHAEDPSDTQKRDQLRVPVTGLNLLQREPADPGGQVKFLLGEVLLAAFIADASG